MSFCDDVSVFLVASICGDSDFHFDTHAAIWTHTMRQGLRGLPKASWEELRGETFNVEGADPGRKSLTAFPPFGGELDSHPYASTPRVT